MKAEKNDIEILNCLTCEKPDYYCEACPIDSQPKLTMKANFYLKLWNRAKRYNQLPVAGGLLDQPESIMLIFDRIESVVDAHNKPKKTEGK